MYVPVSSPRPSPRSLDLSEKLVHLVHEYRAGHPDVCESEIVHAFRLARVRLADEGGDSTWRRSAVVAVAGLLTLVALAGALMLGGAGPSTSPVAAVVIGLAVVGGAVSLTARGRGAPMAPLMIALIVFFVLIACILVLVYSASSGSPVG